MLPLEWANEHAADCPVTGYRLDLLKQLAVDPQDKYLLGAVPEWDEGGDQEAEACECGKA